MILGGKPVAASVKEGLKARISALAEKGVTPGLTVVLVGEHPASQSYVRSKERQSAKLGFKSEVLRLTAETSEAEVLNTVSRLNEDRSVHGILVQLPLPKHIDSQKVIESIHPDKDVDGFHPVSMGKLVLGLDGFVPCTPAGIVEMIKYYNLETKGKHLVVVGRSNIVGKPMANLMLQKKEHANCTVTLCHTATPNMSEFTRQADILVVAAGVAEYVTADMVKEGVIVIDVGINRVEDASSEKGYRIVGDVDYVNVAKKSAAITPVPGGVGLMTVAMLLSNTVKSAENSLN
ncbi:MAG: bifunctional 5,10-methylenetetrahydrofolate dehydrogenase/5,10-methenyltetrahydrofolate cyclohydrolase [Candidatus Marinimicrobia bacterium]|nr:bifunctional 5,10-methylenetetrahydrofolate dehydrogenase/5,10-methenyltetrahydrofolate cyclohydrolase [Candidatus Neomarinimicrobiota bacterium]MCF7850666.1 bifunctional 5,10-methylenetetrahydrofolate dehydrogenase/5,10-methenyltetrahydrofolate cyclohydrolase [Candidatus Neomarinimicrobiota bacterium]MCF7904469.1 bifunctional 5,10-methylenetetrahydrofolate dehydrogenase/5,10-methenyltetrahydrofolate cyclohydrolase [Candidatus Neomarinimicrobiota bacterium]